MARRLRQTVGGLVYHVINRGCGRMKLFGRPADYEAFVKLLCEAHERFPGVRILAFILMPNHWHLVLWPTEDGELARFMGWLTATHVARWRHARKLVGLGPLYQGRFRYFAVESDEHLLTVIRYVERNALRARLVQRGERWMWSSLYLRLSEPQAASKLLGHWPVDEPPDWLDWINSPQTDREVAEMRRHLAKGTPFGSPAWQARAARALGISLTPRPRGRPPKRGMPAQKRENK